MKVTKKQQLIKLQIFVEKGDLLMKAYRIVWTLSRGEHHHSCSVY